MTFIELCNKAFEMLRAEAPYDTGNLSVDALRMVFDDENTCRIWVDESIAPYMPYTNEPWVSSYWKGKQNPNLYWFDLTAEEIMQAIAQSVNGDIRRGSGGDVSVDELAAQFQNKRGDYFHEDVLLHSQYIAEAGDPFATFKSRLALLKK